MLQRSTIDLHIKNTTN